MNQETHKKQYFQLIKGMCKARELDLKFNNDNSVQINGKRYEEIEDVENLLNATRRKY